MWDGESAARRPQLGDEMRKQNYGKIINICSSTVFNGPPNFLHYVTIESGGGLGDLDPRRCRAKLGEDGICVNSLAARPDR